MPLAFYGWRWHRLREWTGWMQALSLENDGWFWRRHVCRHDVTVHASIFGDATCPDCGSLLWVHNAVNKPVNSIIRRLQKRGARFRTNMPYCFKLLDGGGWLPLNRFYRPLGGLPNGCFSETYADRGDMPAPISSRPREGGGYEGYAHLAVHFPIDPRTVSGVWHGRSDGTLWLYNDDPAVRRTYFKRFARLVAAMDTWRGALASVAPD